MGVQRRWCSHVQGGKLTHCFTDQRHTVRIVFQSAPPRPWINSFQSCRPFQPTPLSAHRAAENESRSSIVVHKGKLGGESNFSESANVRSSRGIDHPPGITANLVVLSVCLNSHYPNFPLNTFHLFSESAWYVGWVGTALIGTLHFDRSSLETWTSKTRVEFSPKSSHERHFLWGDIFCQKFLLCGNFWMKIYRSASYTLQFSMNRNYFPVHSRRHNKVEKKFWTDTRTFHLL